MGKFFGKIERKGHEALDDFAGFSHPWDGKQLYNELITYMSTQKLRTPKGLGLVAEALVTCAQDDNASIRVIKKFGGRRIEDSTRRRYPVPMRTTS